MFEHLGTGFFDILAGGTEAGSGLFGVIGRFFEFGGGEAVGGAAASVAEAGLFSAIRSAIGHGGKEYIIYLFCRDILGFTEEGMSQHAKECLEKVRDVAEGHSFLLQQLESHSADKGVQPLLESYKAIGTSLPEEGLLKNVYRKLSSQLHPDRPANAAVGDKLMKQLNAAKDAISDVAKRAEYNHVLETNPEGMKKLLGEMGKIDWKDAYASAGKESQLRLNGPKQNYSRAHKWVSERSGAEQAALVFGVVTAIGLGVYAVAKIVEKRREHKRALQKQTLSHRERVQEDGMPYKTQASRG